MLTQTTQRCDDLLNSSSDRESSLDGDRAAGICRRRHLAAEMIKTGQGIGPVWDAGEYLDFCRYQSSPGRHSADRGASRSIGGVPRDLCAWARAFGADFRGAWRRCPTAGWLAELALALDVAPDRVLRAGCSVLLAALETSADHESEGSSAHAADASGDGGAGRSARPALSYRAPPPP